MADLLYLVHRIPFPPNKGDKVRSYHLLKHLARSHRVYLGTFVDDPSELEHVQALQPFCAEVHAVRLHPKLARLKSMAGLWSGEALTLPYYRSRAMAEWVDATLRERGIRTAVAFSGAMAQYVLPHREVRLIADFVDVDSAKWTQYASSHAWPMSWLYGREGARLLDFESATARRAVRSFFVTAREAQLFRELAPGAADRVDAIGNGVDADYFSPAHALVSPFEPGSMPLVFMGAMDYWPNIDAVTWFASEAMPRLRESFPQLKFYIVGMRPTPAVKALASADIVVTGTVPDVRPYVAHAAVVVAPLRVARGVQNKVLEAMALARPVVVSQACAEAIEAEPGRHFLTASTAPEFVAAIETLLRDPAGARRIGAAARERVVQRYSWDAHLAGIDSYLECAVRDSHAA